VASRTALSPVSSFGQLRYLPSLAGNALFLALFATGLLIQVVLAVRHRTWGYLIAMVGSTGLDIVVYTARIMLHKDDFNWNYFVIYLVGCTIRPSFLSPTTYLCLARIVLMFFGIYIDAEPATKLRTRLITACFIACDLLSLSLRRSGAR
jgi:hypothetical protein